LTGRLLCENWGRGRLSFQTEAAMRSQTTSLIKSRPGADMGTNGSPSFHRGEGRSYQMGRITLTFKADDPNSAYSICETVN
jgi:hypothetical protein